MVADPCGSDLVPGMFGDGRVMLARTRTQFNPTLTASFTTSGYCIWIPRYVGAGWGNTTTVHYTLFYFAGANGSATPVNTSTNPYGAADPTVTTAMNTTGALEDPAYALANGNQCSIVRTVGACMRFSALMALSTLAGQVCVIDNLPVSAFISEANTHPSVNQVFAMAGDARRPGIDTLEIRYKPTNFDAHYVETSEGPVRNQNSTTASTFNFQQNAALEEPRVIGFAWRGMSAGSVLFDFVKIVEWKPQLGSGFVIDPPRPLTENIADKVVAFLDRVSSSWTTENMNTMLRGLQRAQQMAQVGTALYYRAGRRRQYLRDRAEF